LSSQDTEKIQNTQKISSGTRNNLYSRNVDIKCISVRLQRGFS